MNEKKIPTWFWVIAGVALLWNLMGVTQFFNTMLINSQDLAKLTLVQQEHFKNTPLWAHTAFGFATIGGLLGAILLFMKKKMATLIFIVSFLAILFQMINSFVLMNGIDAFGPGGLIMPIMILVVAIYLVWHSKFYTKKGWLN